MTSVAEGLYPILDNETFKLRVPWALLQPHDAQAMVNHGQSLRLLASRGGLHPSEAIALVLDRPWHPMSEQLAAIMMQGAIEEYEASRKPVTLVDLFDPGSLPSRRPEFVTFTGLDERTDLDACLALAQRYPIEWGILVHDNPKARRLRYPRLEKLGSLDGLNLAVHLCGDRAYSVSERGTTVVGPLLGRLLEDAHRVQVNVVEPRLAAIVAWAKTYRCRPIVQCRNATTWPTDTDVDWLFDQSGGRGQVPTTVPAYPTPPRLVGYAGGLDAECIGNAMDNIDAQGPYWLDMESGVRTLRDSDEWFDLAKCEAVCRALWGER